MAADNDGEWFDLVDDEDRVIGRELRSVVHRNGLLHRAVYVWVFRPDGALLVQRRSLAKRIGPGQWDLSVAEHLQPGESYLQGAVRGLAEELGIVADADALAGPLAPTHRRELRQGGDFHDVELVQSYRLDKFEGGVRLDEAEVCEARWATLHELRADVAARPEAYTQWFREEFASLGWFQQQAGLVPQQEQRRRQRAPAAAVAAGAAV